MAFLKRICMVITFMLLRSYNADSNMEESRFSHNLPSHKKLFKPLIYNVLLDLQFKENNYTFSGETSYLFVIKNPTRKITWNANGLEIIKIWGMNRYPYWDIFSITENVRYSKQEETLIVNFETYVPSGLYTIKLKFKGNMSETETGVYWTSYKDNGVSKSILTTQLKPTTARRVFPCWDEPSLKARFALEIIHRPNYGVMSNMPLRFQDVLTGDTWSFHPTPPIPTYMVAFSSMALADFICYRGYGREIKISMCSRPSIMEPIMIAVNRLVDVGSYLQLYMDISPQISEITIIALPDFPYNVTGNWGLNIYRESHLIYNKTLHSIDQKLDISMYVANTMALQWFGNLVSPTSWMDMWFFQALALFYGAKAAAETYPDKDIKFLFTYRLQSLAREDNAVSKMKFNKLDVRTLNESEIFIELNHFKNYLREYAIMIMLEDTVGEIIFRNVTIKYLKKHQFSSATPDDFWAMLEHKINYGVQRSSYHYPSIIEKVHVWLKLRKLPVITVVQEEFDDVIIGIENVDIAQDYDNSLIHINYVIMSNPKRVLSFWLGRHKRFILKIPLTDWVIVNWKQTGYYRVKYDYWIWRRMTTYLNSVNYTNIHVLNRAHIIEDAYYFWSQDKLETTGFAALISYIAYEEECAPWYAMQKVIQKMWTFLNIDNAEPLRGVILYILEQLLQETGYTENPSDTECTKFKRLLATKWACRLFHEECLEIAKQRLIEHLEDIQRHIIPPIWEEWTYCNGLVRSDMYTWQLVYRKIKETNNTRILEYLGCSENSTIIILYLNLVGFRVLKSDSLYFKTRQDIYRSTVLKHIKKNVVFDYAMQKLLKLDIGNELIYRSFIEELSYYIKNVYSSSQIDKIRSLFEGDSKYYRNRLWPLIQHQYLVIYKLEHLRN